jgi:hypothetical protein
MTFPARPPILSFGPPAATDALIFSRPASVLTADGVGRPAGRPTTEQNDLGAHVRSASQARDPQIFGDLISYQNDGKGCTANACKAGEREWVFQYMDKYAPRQRPQFGMWVKLP